MWPKNDVSEKHASCNQMHKPIMEVQKELSHKLIIEEYPKKSQECISLDTCLGFNHIII